MTRSKAACEFSIERLAAGRDSLYLWTFTMGARVAVGTTCEVWSNARRNLVRKLGMSGVRVFEMHPGGHGLHIHLVCAEFFDVNAVRAVTTAAGMGRIHVERIPAGRASYVAKYLGKPCADLKGRRRWEPVGPFRRVACRVRSVEYDSPAVRVFRRIDRQRVARAHGLSMKAAFLKCFEIAKRHAWGVEDARKWMLSVEMVQQPLGGVA